MPDPTQQHTVAAMLAAEVTDSDIGRIADMPLNAERAGLLRALGDRAAQLTQVAHDAGVAVRIDETGHIISRTSYSEPREIARLLLPISVTAFTAISDALDGEYPGATVGATTNGWLVFRRPPAPEAQEHNGG